MKRKQFIQKFSLLGVGLGLTPWRLVSANSSTNVYQLPEPTVHIPHGNFASSEVEKAFFSDLNLECSVEQFMRNGIEPSQDDLTVYSFKKGDEMLNIGFTRSGKETTEGSISGLDLRIDSNGREFVVQF